MVVSSLVTSPHLEGLSSPSAKRVRAWVQVPKNQPAVLKTGCLSSAQKKRNGKRNSIERKKATAPQGSPVPAQHKQWPLFPTFAMAQFLISCHQSQPTSSEEDRRNGTAAVRVTRISCRLPDRRSQRSTGLQQQWLRKDGPRTINPREVGRDWEEMGGVPAHFGPRSIVSHPGFSGEKASKGLLVPGIVNVER